MEEDLFWIDRMGTTVSAPSQATVHSAKNTSQELYYEYLDEGEARQFPTPNLCCAVVSVFWLWREIVLKMKTNLDYLRAVSTKKSYWVTLV